MASVSMVLLGIFILLQALGFLGMAIPNIILGIVGLLAGIMVIVAGITGARVSVP